MGERPPILTAVRRVRPGQVELEVDGERWRRVPDQVVLGCGLAPGVELDRPLLRDVRRELRRAEALDAALRTVTRRDVSTRMLRERLDVRGIRAPAAESAVEALAGAGLLDDARTARSRAVALAGRGWGDAAVAVRLEGEGFAQEDVRLALAELEPEEARARPLAARAGGAARAWRLLARRGFSPGTLEAVVQPVDEDR